VVPFPEKSIEVSDPVVKVTRVLEMVGKASWVMRTLNSNYINVGSPYVTPHGTVTEIRRITEGL
jgi:hypothetical protein